MEREKHVDESWKDAVANEGAAGPGPQGEPVPEEMELNFVNYITSLALQAMIFLGEIPNPMTEKVEQNLRQAKFLIDTLILLRDKTKGNLSPEEDNLLNSAVYELQVKFIELSKGQGPLITP